MLLNEYPVATLFSLPPSVLPMLARKHRVPGVQLAIHQAGVTTVWETGELEIQTCRRVTKDAVFPIGSITKCFTATVAMILAADGDVDLDEPVAEYAPETSRLGHMFTLRQLLSHTGGLADMPGGEEVPSLTLRRYVADHVHSGNLVLPPGADFSYSSLGYALAGRLIETVTGMPWAEAVESILLRPLEIEASFVHCPGARPARRPFATGHSANVVTGRVRPAEQSIGPAIAPAGGLALSAEDLVKLGLIHVGPGLPRLLPHTYAHQMRQASPHTGPFWLADAWSPGFAIFRHETADWIGHDGNAEGTACYLRINPAEGWVVAFTSNANTGIALWQDLQAELSREGVPIDPPRALPPGAPRLVPLPGCAGRYVNGDVTYEVTAAANRPICLSIDGGEYTPLIFHENLSFSIVDSASGRQMLGGRFVPEPATGKIYGIQVGGRFACHEAFTPTVSSADRRLLPAR